MLRFIEPLDGTICHPLPREAPLLRCRIESDAAFTVSVNGALCAFPDDTAQRVHEVSVPLSGKTNRLTVLSASGEAAAITAYLCPASDKLYRLSLDDCIWFLQDIAANANRYASIFENPFLSMLRRFHDSFGTKAHMNIYLGCPEHGGFHLRDMPDTFLSEWEANRDWLRLSFHARADQPDKPYRRAGYEQVAADCAEVMREIRRFAGGVGPVTTLHWAEAQTEGIRALYGCGVRALLGYFTPDAGGIPEVSYSATPAQMRAVRSSGFWRDPETKMVFFACDAVLNSLTPDEIGDRLDQLAETYPNRNFMDILIHEQYFYPDYGHFLPDYRQRVESGIRWCERHGYRPGFVEDAIGPLLDLD